MKAIIAFEVEVMEIDNVFKLSQNRDEESFHNIIAQLHSGGADADYIAEEMSKRSSQLFNDESRSEP
jgi:transcriptional regulator